MIKQLRRLAREGYYRIKTTGVSKTTLEQELNFIERRQMEGYFLTAYKLVQEIKKDKNILLGPGRSWMISSHVCRTLGVTAINPGSVGITPILVWGDESYNPVIDIEVDEDSFSSTFTKAIEAFGFDNVARMPALQSDNNDLKGHEAIGLKTNGEKVFLHGCAMLICPDGISKHIPVDEITDDNGINILCAKEFYDNCENREIYRFNVWTSSELTRIKSIQKLISENGKKYPLLYEKDIWHEKYDVFYKDDLNDIPLFEYANWRTLTHMLIKKQKYGSFNELLTIMGLFIKKKGYNLLDEDDIEEFQCEHGVYSLLGEKIFPWGFLFKEDVAWLLNGWIGLTWIETAQVIKQIKVKDIKETQRLMNTYLRHGIDNGFNEQDLLEIWNELFNTERNGQLVSMAHCTGELYLSVFLGRLKTEFPNEFKAISERVTY